MILSCVIPCHRAPLPQATVSSLQVELSNYKTMLDNLSGGKSDLERKLADLAREHQGQAAQWRRGLVGGRKCTDKLNISRFTA